MNVIMPEELLYDESRWERSKNFALLLNLSLESQYCVKVHNATLRRLFLPIYAFLILGMSKESSSNYPQNPVIYLKKKTCLTKRILVISKKISIRRKHCLNSR